MKIKKLIFLSILIILSSFSFGYANDLIGTYVTKPEIFPGFHKPYSEKVKKGIDTLTWKMKITETDIIIEMRKNLKPLVIPYKIQGKFLLGKESDTEIVAYIPFYVENKNTIHGYNAVFFRTN